MFADHLPTTWVRVGHSVVVVGRTGLRRVLHGQRRVRSRPPVVTRWVVRLIDRRWWCPGRRLNAVLDALESVQIDRERAGADRVGVEGVVRVELERRLHRLHTRSGPARSRTRHGAVPMHTHTYTVGLKVTPFSTTSISHHINAACDSPYVRVNKKSDETSDRGVARNLIWVGINVN